MRVSPPLPSPLHRYTFSAVHSRAAEGGFDLWKPAGRFTNIKFAFKRVGADAAEGGSHVCTLHGWIYRVILEEAALERRSRKKRKKKRKKEKERKKESLDPSRCSSGRRWVFLIGHGKTRACGGELWIVLVPCSFIRERKREASLAAFPDRSVGNRRREKERLINRRKRFR